MRSPILSLVAVAATAAVVLSAQAPAHATNPTPQRSSGAAESALEQAQALLGPVSEDRAEARTERRTAPPAESQAQTRDATLVLRDLNLLKDQLDPAGQRTAARLLDRPSGNRTRDFPSVRVHWTADTGVTSDYVDQVGATVGHVLATYKKAGYRAPKSDGTRGGNGLLDVYLQDLGSHGLYGYCSSDHNPNPRGPYDTWAYCAFDDNYTEFPTHTPLQNLQVTAAHELFHAVQFAYDYYEDAWFMEATATWAEDELYDKVNDNLQYLVQSPLTQPGASMDHFAGVRQYGDWIFYRYLTERFSRAQGGMPTLVRDMWRRADGATGGPDKYSIQATASALAARGTNLRTQFAKFADANRRPARAYSEGRANRYPVAKLAGHAKLRPGHTTTGWKGRRVDHLASATYAFNRAPRLKARALRVQLDLPATARGSQAVITVYRKSGRVHPSVVKLSRKGDAIRKVPYGGSVRRVEVSLVNASMRYRCGTAPSAGFSCAGRSVDNNLRMRVRVSALK